jgi:hypothetical protein
MNQTRYFFAAFAFLFVLAVPSGDLFAQYGSCGTLTPSTWGSSPFINYTMTGGVLITDPSADVSPAMMDLVTSTADGSAVSVAFNGATAFFRVQLADDPTRSGNGGFANNCDSYIVQIANTAGTHLATVGVDAKSNNDFVFAQNPTGTLVASFFHHGTFGYAGMRATAVPGATTYYFEFQVPLCVLDYVTGGAVTATTPIKLYFGTSASNSVVNKDFSTPGNTVDFSLMTTMSMNNVQIGVLPVELTSFTASVRNGDVHLRWHTATETNNAGFEVQRRDAGSTMWTPLTFVAGHGTASAPHDYAHIDRSVPAGSWEYRLRQVDRDGTEDHSAVLAVSTGAQAEGLHLLGASPMPLRGSAQVRFTLSSTDQVTVELTDLLGRRVAASPAGLQLDAGTHAVTLQIDDAPSGTYLLSVRTPQQQQLQTVAVVR